MTLIKYLPCWVLRLVTALFSHETVRWCHLGGERKGGVLWLSALEKGPHEGTCAASSQRLSSDSAVLPVLGPVSSFHGWEDRGKLPKFPHQPPNRWQSLEIVGMLESPLQGAL